MEEEYGLGVLKLEFLCMATWKTMNAYRHSYLSHHNWFAVLRSHPESEEHVRNNKNRTRKLVGACYIIFCEGDENSNCGKC